MISPLQVGVGSERKTGGWKNRVARASESPWPFSEMLLVQVKRERGTAGLIIPDSSVPQLITTKNEDPVA